jgi:hypothetical protein
MAALGAAAVYHANPQAGDPVSLPMPGVVGTAASLQDHAAIVIDPLAGTNATLLVFTRDGRFVVKANVAPGAGAGQFT